MTLKDRQREALTIRRATFVYEAARLAARAAHAPAIPEPWNQRDNLFRAHFLDDVEHQTGDSGNASPERLHEQWVLAYKSLGWVLPTDIEEPAHLDMVPYHKPGQLERDEGSIFVALCEIARRWIY